MKSIRVNGATFMIALSLALVIVFCGPTNLAVQAQYPCPVEVMGDYNDDGMVTTADIIHAICILWKGCYYDCVSLARADVNCSQTVTSADILTMVNYVFRGEPFPCDVCDDFYSGARSCP